MITVVMVAEHSYMEENIEILVKVDKGPSFQCNQTKIKKNENCRLSILLSL